MAIVLFLAALLVGSAYSQTTYSSATPAAPSPSAPSPSAPSPSAPSPSAPSPSAPSPSAPSPSAPSPSAPSPSAPTPSPSPSAPSPSPTPSAPSPSPSAPSGSGSCVPVNPNYSNLSGEALFKQLLSDLATQEVAVNNVAKANPNTPINNSSGFFLSVILSVNQDNLKLQSLLTGATLTGADCLATNQRLGQDIANVQAHAQDTIPGGSCSSLTGDAQYQYQLQQLGQALNNIQVQAQLPANVQNTYPGPYLTIIQNLNSAITRITNVIKNNDTSAECTNASIAIANALKGILSSTGATIS